MEEVSDRKRIKKKNVNTTTTTTKHRKKNRMERTREKNSQTEQIKDEVFGLQLLFAMRNSGKTEQQQQQ